MEKKCNTCGRVFKNSDFKLCPYCGSKLISREGRQPIPRELRHKVFKRDGYRCRECGASKDETTLEIDHIIPVSKGGTNDIDNLQTLCRECNRKKHDDEWVAGETDIETLAKLEKSLQKQIKHYKNLLEQSTTEDEEIEYEYELIQLNRKLVELQREIEEKKEEQRIEEDEKKLEEKIDKLYKKAVVTENQGKYGEAIECYEKLNKLKPYNKEYQNKQKELEEKIELAIEYYGKTIKLEQQGNYEEAKNTINKAIELDPTNTKYKNKQKKLQELQEKKKQQAQKEYQKAIKLEQKEYFKSAINYINKAIELDPTNKEYQNKLRIIITKTDLELEEQVAYIEAMNYIKAIELDPTNKEYQNKQKELKQKEKRNKELLMEYNQKALKLEKYNK